MSKKEFFVGYEVGFPGRLKVFYSFILPMLILGAVGLAYGLSKDTPAAGSGTWDLSEQVTLKGVVMTKPYPMIVTEARKGHSVLIVQLGKMGAQKILEDFDGKSVSITGSMIERGPWQMLEIEGTASVEEIDPLNFDKPEMTAGDQVMLDGEIVDSKCMLGVMKPGMGKVHRDCAQLCVLGGLPPMLLITNGAGEKVAYLLTDRQGRALDERILPYVATPIELSGELSRLGNMSIIRVDVDSIDKKSADVNPQT